MDQQKIASFISERRKTQNMTQKELADKLNVTDKAISKWERGQGYPDISLIVPLAQALGVTANDLLTGGDNFAAPTQIQVAPYNQPRRVMQWRPTKKTANLLFIILTFSFLAADFVCALVDFVLNQTFTWSLYVLGATLLVWFCTLPFFRFQKLRVVSSLSVLSLLFFPFLALVEYVSGGDWLLTVGLPVGLIGLAETWLLVCLFAYTKISRWYILALLFLSDILFDFTLEHILKLQQIQPVEDPANLLSMTLSLIMAAAALLIGYFYKKRHHSG